MLALDGQALVLKSMKVQMSMELKDQDMSGQSSGTDTAEQGDKGKKLTFTGQIPFIDDDLLSQLYQFASNKDSSHVRKVYRISNLTAKTLKIRNVKFTGNITANENDTLQAWDVSFSLREHNSVAEQKEQRTKTQTKPEQTQNTRMQQALAEAEEATQ